MPECKLHGGLPVRSAPRRKRPGLRCRGSHPRRLPGGSQYALLTPLNLARVPALDDMPPRHLPVLPVRIIRPGGSVPIRPPPFPRDSTLSRHSTEATLAFVQARGRTRWGVNREPYPSGSARQQDKSRRSTWVRREQAPKVTAGSPPAVGSGRQADVHRDTGATVQDASRTSEAHGPEPGHLVARRARRRRQAGRALGGRADGTGAPGEPPWRSANGCPRRMPKASSAGG